MDYRDIHRENVLNHLGTWRDSVLYSILQHEWDT
jgi:RimJ/RimL family protein N-acetyltransferase